MLGYFEKGKGRIATAGQSGGKSGEVLAQIREHSIIFGIERIMTNAWAHYRRGADTSHVLGLQS